LLPAAMFLFTFNDYLVLRRKLECLDQKGRVTLVEKAILVKHGHLNVDFPAGELVPRYKVLNGLYLPPDRK